MKKTHIDTHSDYSGCILTDNFSQGLKERVARCILCYQEAEKNGNPAVQYLSAWKEKEKIIWYEFVGDQFRHLLRCDRGKEAEVFRDSIIERRVYKYDGFDHEVQQEALNRTDLTAHKIPGLIHVGHIKILFDQFLFHAA